MDQSKTPEQRATALLAASTQHQKYRWLVEQPANSPAQTTFSGVVYPVQVDCTPTVVYTDGPEGVRAPNGVTTFPSQISLASTWSALLAEAKGTAMGDESFDKRRNGILAPGIGSGRTPLAGRTPEYFGEDPVLSGLLAAAQVEGIQNPTGDRAVMGELKHYVANEQELDRQTSNSIVSERALREIYDLPYEIALSESSPASVMCSFNQLNGVFACENERLTSVLRDDFDFKGYVVSDFGAVHSTATALMKGLDQELNRPRFFTPALLDAALAAGEITQARIDEAASRVVTTYISTGLFDHPMADTAVVDASTADHKALARTLSEQGSVLLKNDGKTLPLTAGAGLKVALFGPTASDTATGGVSAKTICSLFLPFGGGRNTMPCENLVSPEAGIRAAVEAAGGTVTWNAGTDLVSVKADAAAADVAIVLGYQRMGEFSDLADLHLQGGGDSLIDAVADAAHTTVVVLQTGSAVEMPWLAKVDAVLENWYGGEQMGTAIANILFGAVNPSGKLTMTFPKSLADVPTRTAEQYPGVFANGSTTRPAGSTEIRQVSYTEGLEVGYRWYASAGIEPLFEFGHGLSYTDFAYSHLQVTPTSNDGRHEVRVRFRVTNTGAVAGTETAQAYIALPTVAQEPSKRLVGWTQVTLEPGEHSNVVITLTADDLRNQHLLEYFDAEADAWKTAPGTYLASVGGSFSTALSDTFTVRR